MSVSEKAAAGPSPARERPDAHIRDKHVPLPSVQDAIQERLRAAYAEVLREPVPQRFIDLLNGLENRPEPEDRR